jgi:hypothetical protein
MYLAFLFLALVLDVSI